MQNSLTSKYERRSHDRMIVYQNQEQCQLFFFFSQLYGIIITRLSTSFIIIIFCLTNATRFRHNNNERLLYLMLYRQAQLICSTMQVQSQLFDINDSLCRTMHIYMNLIFLRVVLENLATYTHLSFQSLYSIFFCI